MTQAFAYHRAVAPMMWVLVAIAMVELIVVHFLVALWSVRWALGLSLVSLAGIVWLIRAILSFRKLPLLLDEAGLVMRAGHLRRIDVPLAAIAGLRRDWDAAAIKQRSVANLALIAYPNIVIDLRSPIDAGPGRRAVMAVAHRLDDPAAFVAALERLRAAA